MAALQHSLSLPENLIFACTYRSMTPSYQGRVLRSGLILAVLFSLGACNSKAKDEQPPVKIFQEERQALDKAKGVQQTLEQQQQKDSKQIEEQSK